MKKTLLVFSICILALSPLVTLAQGWQWAKTADISTTSGSAMGSAHAWPVAADASGNVYMAMWSGFDSLGVGASMLHSTAYQTQVVLVKYDKNGNVIWVRSSTEGNTMPIDIAVDANNNVLLYGYFSGENVKFGSQVITNTAGMGANTCYILKYDADGNIVWKVNSGTISLGSEKQSYGSITTDKLGNVYAAATYFGTVKIGVATLTNSGGEDVSVAKYSAGGGLVWAKRFGGAGYEKVSGITVSNDNSLYLTGDFSSPSLPFGPSTLYYSATAPSSGYACYNIFLAKLTTDGNVTWARQSTGHSRVMSIVADSASNVYIGGSLRSDTVSFSGNELHNNGGNPFYAKYSTTGDLQRLMPFVQTITSEGHDYAIWDLAVDACNHIWVSGGMDTIFGNGVFLDSIIVMPLPQERTDPLFIASYTDEGVLADYASIGSGGMSNSGLAADMQGNIYLCGYYDASKSLRIGADSVNAVPNAYKNYFVAKYAPYNSCIPNSISEVGTSGADINVFPNPAAGLLNITAPYAVKQVTVSDMLGKTVLAAPGNQRAASIDVSRLSPGIYLVRINGQHVRRFVKE